MLTLEIIIPYSGKRNEDVYFVSMSQLYRNTLKSERRCMPVLGIRAVMLDALCQN
jgi:hypothetical protein